MSLREQLRLRDGKARPPAVLPKTCVHNGTPELEHRARGDMSFDIEFINGQQVESYNCLQCGYTISEVLMMSHYQNYMAHGVPITVGRKIKNG